MNRESENEPQVATKDRRPALHITILLLCVVVLILARLSELNDADLYLLGLKSPHRCPLYHMLGVKCALCGLTRSFSSLAHANLTQAFRFHTLGPAIFAFTCFQIPYRILAVTLHPRKLNKIVVKTNVSLAVMLVVAIVVNWLIYLGGFIL